MKKWKGCFLAIVAAICLFWIFPEQTPAASNSVIVSVGKKYTWSGLYCRTNHSAAKIRGYCKNSYGTGIEKQWNKI